MRNVAPIALADLKPASLSGRTEPTFDRLVPSTLLVDESHQRGLSRRSEELIRTIVEGWDWLKFKPPVVAMTERGFEVVDGQHTAIAAACHPEITTIPVLVVGSADLPHRARTSVNRAVDHLQDAPMREFRGAVASGERSATEVLDILERAGVTLLRSTPADGVWRQGQTLALREIRTLVSRRGPERAHEVLAALARADLAPIEADHIRVAEAFLIEEEFTGAFDPESTTEAFQSLSPKILAQARELALAEPMPHWRALMAIMYRHFALDRTRARSRGPRVRRPSRSGRASDPDATTAPGKPSAVGLGRPTEPRHGARNFDVLGHTVRPSPQLASVVGPGPMLRTDAIAALSRYIDSHHLNDPSDRHTVVADDKLKAVFGKDRIPVSELGRIWSQEPQTA